MIVVADATPIRHLAAIGLGHMLEQLHGHVFIPRRVWLELNDESTPANVSKWLSQNLTWISVESPVPDLGLDFAADSLDPGELEAIQLAIQLCADLIVIDDRDGRAVATRLGLSVTGTLGILEEADRRGLIVDFPEALDHLIESGFYVSNSLIRLLIERHLKRIAT